MKHARPLDESLIACLVSKKDHMVIILSGTDAFNGIGGVFRQAGHIVFQPLPVFGAQRCAQRTRQRTLQAAFPARSVVMEVGPPTIHLTRWVNKDPVRAPHNASQRTLG